VNCTEKSGVKIFQFELFNNFPIKHGIFTRLGGVSPAPWASLNMGGTVGDARENVAINRERAFKSLDRDGQSLLDVWQVHGTDILISNLPRGLDNPHQKADGLISNSNAVTLMMRFADCVPLLFYAPKQKVVGLAHAGWKGTLNKIGLKMVQIFHENFHIEPEDILVGIGPSIGLDHYSVGIDVVSEFRKEFEDEQSIIFKNGEEGHIFLDLGQANRRTLEQAGVTKIEISGICTACNLRDWYSHRGEKGVTGRFGVILGLD
jgi:YfiH family protein